jgi:hypothetical protein
MSTCLKIEKPYHLGLQNYETFWGDRKHRNEYFVFLDRLLFIIDLELKNQEITNLGNSFELLGALNLSYKILEIHQTTLLTKCS